MHTLVQNLVFAVSCIVPWGSWVRERKTKGPLPPRNTPSLRLETGNQTHSWNQARWVQRDSVGAEAGNASRGSGSTRGLGLRSSYPGNCLWSLTPKRWHLLRHFSSVGCLKDLGELRKTKPRKTKTQTRRNECITPSPQEMLTVRATVGPDTGNSFKLLQISVVCTKGLETLPMKPK